MPAQKATNCYQNRSINTLLLMTGNYDTLQVIFFNYDKLKQFTLFKTVYVFGLLKIHPVEKEREKEREREQEREHNTLSGDVVFLKYPASCHFYFLRWCAHDFFSVLIFAQLQNRG